ncbi:phage tail tube protein [Enterobacter roggenkampii]|uniref:phage tail tube protein n=1 Tax=Enterobacter roggenkampii TaxID=1812935 RepID=UPI002A7EDE67|nr:phage tail tube protein [Enterobacter roggenkampii]
MIPDIAAALAARLGEWADTEGIPVAWENVPFTPPSNGIYLAVHDMPATPRTLDLGLRCRIYSGVYQINVVAPVGIGRSAADDIAVGDIVHVNCNWSGIDNVIAKIDAITENAVTLRNINTTNKNKYAAGGGSGSIRKIEEWTELPQITEVSKSGGDQNTTQIQFLSDDRQRNLNTYKSAVSQTYSIAHDSTLPVYPLLRQLDEDEETVAAYMYVPKAKENRYWAATASFDDTPTTAVNEVETVSVVLNLQSPAMTFYKVTDAAA